MGRAKQRMELISNKKTRNLTFDKRKKGMKKKAYELKTLCDVEVCMIIYGPKPDDGPIEAEIWPSGQEDSINSLINSYRSQPVEDRTRRTLDLSNFFQDRNQKIEDELAKLRKKNSEARYTTWDERYDSFTKEDLVEFESILENQIQVLRSRIDVIKYTQKVTSSHYQFYPVTQPFYGTGNVHPVPFPYEGNAGHYSSQYDVSSFPTNLIMHNRQTTSDDMIKLDNGNLGNSGGPLSIQSFYPSNMQQQQQQTSQNFLYHLQMSNVPSSHAHSIQMEDYYGCRDSQIKNFMM